MKHQTPYELEPVAVIDRLGLIPLRRESSDRAVGGTARKNTPSVAGCTHRHRICRSRSSTGSTGGRTPAYGRVRGPAVACGRIAVGHLQGGQALIRTIGLAVARSRLQLSCRHDHAGKLGCRTCAPDHDRQQDPSLAQKQSYALKSR